MWLTPICEWVKLLSHVQLFATPWTAVHQALCPQDFPGKSTRVGCHFLLQGIFPAQGSNPGLPHCRQMLLPSKPPGVTSQDFDPGIPSLGSSQPLPIHSDSHMGQASLLVVPWHCVNLSQITKHSKWVAVFYLFASAGRLEELRKVQGLFSPLHSSSSHVLPVKNIHLISESWKKQRHTSWLYKTMSPKC